MTLALCYLSFSVQTVKSEDTKCLLDISLPRTDFTGTERRQTGLMMGRMIKKNVVRRWKISGLSYNKVMKARIVVRRRTVDARKDQYRSGDGKRCIGDHVLHWTDFSPLILPPLWQLLLTSIILPKEENERGRAEQRINCHLTV